jgi:outer membrane protein assembly factor BamB
MQKLENVGHVMSTFTQNKAPLSIAKSLASSLQYDSLTVGVQRDEEKAAMKNEQVSSCGAGQCGVAEARCGAGKAGFSVAALIAVVLATTAYSSDWPRFRGPNCDGHTTEPISKWPPQEVWRANICGGFSQVVVSRGHVYTMGNNNNQDVLYCYSESSTGTNPAPLWVSSYGSSSDEQGYQGTRSTPTVDGGKVYTFSAEGLLNCFDSMSGALLWSNTTVNVGGPQYGFASSPWIEGDLVIVNSGSSGAAVSKTTHNVVWGNVGGAGYASPFGVTIGAQRTIVVYNGGDVTGVDPANGNVMWDFGWHVPTVSGIPTPMVFDGNKLWVSAGYGAGCAVVNIDSGGQLLVDGAGEWTSGAMCNRCNSIVIYNGYAYGVDEGAGLCCVDLSNGTRKWCGGGGGMGSSVLLANDQLVVMTDDGNLIVANASPTSYQEVHRLNVPGGSWTPPTISNGKLYVRGTGEVICYQVGTDVSGATGYRMPIHFTGYNKPETLTNFPALVVLSNNVNNSGFDYGLLASPSGSDLRFYSADTEAELNYEVEQWNTNGASYVWVQVPTISGTNGYIWAYWGDPNNSTFPYYTTNGATWDSTFAAVWHFSDYVQCGGMQKDSTTNHNDIQFLDGGYAPNFPGQPHCSTSGVPCVVAGGDAMHGWMMDPYSDLRMTNDTASLQCLNHSTMSLWARSDDPSQWACVLMMGKENRLVMHGVPGSPQVTFNAPGLSGGCAGATASPGTWNYLAGVWDSASTNAYIYCNGLQSDHQTGSSAVPVIGSTDGILTIGGNAGDGSGGSRVSVDEARVDAVPRSSNWVWACYMTMASNSSFCSCGSYGGVAATTSIVQFTSSAYSVPENGGSVTVTVFRTNGRSGAMTVDYATGGGTAVAGVNYVTATGTLNYANGETSKTFTVSVMDDGVWTPGNKTVKLNLSHATGSSMFGSPSNAVLTLVDVDGPGSFQFGSSGYAAGQDVGTMSITVTRANGKTGAASVNYATSDGTAVAAVNYTATAGTLNFANNETSKTFSVTILNQAVGESGKTLNVNLSNPTAGATVGSPGTAFLRINTPGPFSSCAYNMNISFPGYSGSEVLTSFPVLLVFSNRMGGGFNYNQVASPLVGDLRFADATGTNMLNFEIEKWAPGGSSYVWVQVPALTNSCFIWAYWGNPATNLPVCTTNGATWDSTFAGVWHLKEATGVTSADSTTNNNSGTPANSPSQGNGIIDGALSFNGSSSCLNMTKRATSAQDNWTLEAWINPGTLPQGVAMAIYNGDDYAGYGFGVGSGSGGSGSELQGVYGSVGWIDGGYAFPSPNAWYHVVMERSSGTASFYVNGTKTTGTSTATPYAPNNSLTVGDEYTSGASRWFNGGIDEVRVSRIPRSASWIMACYMNIASNSVFCGYGGGSSGTAAMGTPILWLNDNGLSGDYNAQELADPDGDGVPTWQEYIMGTDPANGSCVLKATIQRQPGGGIAVSFSSLSASGPDYAGKTRYYDLETTTNLFGGVWLPVTNETNIVGTNVTVNYTNTFPDTKRYYRVGARLQ